jgi:hypothetical protein
MAAGIFKIFKISFRCKGKAFHLQCLETAELSYVIKVVDWAAFCKFHSTDLENFLVEKLKICVGFLHLDSDFLSVALHRVQYFSITDFLLRHSKKEVII